MKKLLLVCVPVALAFLEVSDASACGGVSSGGKLPFGETR